MTIPTKDKNENDLKILLGENNLQEMKRKRRTQLHLQNCTHSMSIPTRWRITMKWQNFVRVSARTEFCRLFLFDRRRTGNMKLFPVTGGYLLAAGWDLKMSLLLYNR